MNVFEEFYFRFSYLYIFLDHDSFLYIFFSPPTTHHPTSLSKPRRNDGRETLTQLFDLGKLLRT